MTDANRYQINDNPEVTITVTSVTGTVVAADILFLKVKEPDGTITSYAETTNMSAQGAWDASANSPTLADGTGTKGHYYTVSAAGTVNFGNGAIIFTTDDWVYYDGARWRKADNAEAGSFTNPSTGVYKLPVKIYDGVGVWHYAAFGDGDKTFGAQHKFYVDASEFD